jgi:probable HAF family extracellular repeat protein
MRLASQLARIAAATIAPDLRTARSRPPLVSTLTALATLALLAACRGDVLTAPRGIGTTPPDLTLTGGVGTQIFPTVTLGEFQPGGVAIGLNDAGQVAGSGWTTPIADDAQAFRWSVSTGAQALIGCCGTLWGKDINNAGVIVGTKQTSQIIGNRGFIASGLPATPLPILAAGDPEGSADAVAINDAGQTVGRSPANGFAQHAVLWSAAGVIQDLGTLGGTNSQAIDINASAQVIGSSQIAGDAATHFFLWSSGSGMQDLNATVDAGITGVVEINDAGQIIGTYTTGGQSHAFLYTPGTGLRDLGTLGGTTSAPTGLNDKGDVVGSSTLSNGSTHAFLWTAAEGMEDITALSGVPEVRRLNDNLQTLTGTASPIFPIVQRLRPRLVQLQVTQSNAPPTALFNTQCNGLTCVLDGSVSLDDKPGLTFAWNLGKFPGGSATGAKVTVTYPHAGPRTVTLTVTDAQGLKSTIAHSFTVTDFPIAAFTTSCTGLTCTFDSGPSTNNGAPIAERNWDFGDGQTAFNTLAPSHTFAQAGTYNVTLEILGNIFAAERAVITQQVTVTAPAQNQPPTASFTYTCTGQSLAHQCAFNASGSTDDHGIVSYAWSWGNGRSETKIGPTVRNTWAAPGTYSVTLTTKDAGGLTASQSQQVVVP